MLIKLLYDREFTITTHKVIYLMMIMLRICPKVKTLKINTL